MTIGVAFWLGARGVTLIAASMAFALPVNMLFTKALRSWWRFALYPSPEDAAVLRDCHRRVNAAGWDHPVDPWTANLGRHVLRLVEALPDRSTVFTPPLWPFPGLYNVALQLSIAPPKHVLQRVATEDRDVFRALACDIEHKFWGAIDWEILHQDEPRTSPYYPVLQLVSRGLYPLGVESDLFIVFGRAAGS